MPNVAFIRPELAKLLPQYKLIADCLEGETKVKAEGEKYLPKPNAADKSLENTMKYRAYLARAVFYNVSRRTLAGLVGQIFMVDPVVKVPNNLKVVEENVSGTGISLVQQCKKASSYTLAFSRAGLFIDYPEVPEGGATIADLEEGRIRPTITLYHPMNVINWRVVDRGSEEVKSLVVLVETYAYEDDGFEMKLAVQIRVLALNADEEVTIQLWREKSPTTYKQDKLPTGEFQIYKTFAPRDASGMPLKEIPFTFIGSDNNDTDPDEPNFYDLASVNIAHYRNSADYEQNVYMLGQSTPVLIGLSQDWVDNVLKGQVSFGSTGGIMLPPGADAKTIQAEENGLVKEAMEAKERQMTALGAKLVEQRSVQRTAFETKVEATSEGSTLLSVANNVQDAYLWALKFCAKYTGDSEEGIEFSLNTDFDISQMTADERNEVLLEYEGGVLSFTEVRDVLRKAGLATQDDATAKAEIEKEAKASVERQQMVSQANKPAADPQPTA